MDTDFTFLAYVLYIKALYAVVRMAVCVACMLRMLCVYVGCTSISESLFCVLDLSLIVARGLLIAGKEYDIAVSCHLHSSDPWSFSIHVELSAIW